MKALYLLIALVFSVSTLSAQPCQEFKGYFEKAAKTYLRHIPAIDAQYLAAQAYAESGCRTNARSPVGAKGLAQFMPATWKEVSRKVPQLRRGTADDPALATLAQAYYMGMIYEFCGKRIKATPTELRQFTTASYNAGLGNICIKAYKRIDGTPTWRKAAEELSHITGRHSKETDYYVRKVEKTYGETAKHSYFNFISSAHASEVDSAGVSQRFPTETKRIVKEIIDEADDLKQKIKDAENFLWKTIFLNYQFAFGPAIIGMILLIGAYKLFDRLTPRVDFATALSNGNMALSYIICVFMLMIGLILTVSINAGINTGG